MYDIRFQGIPPELWGLIAQIDEMKGRWSEQTRLSPHVLDTLRKTTLITSSGASTRIEGAKLSDEDVEKLLSNLTIQKMISRDTQEVGGYHKVLTRVFSDYRHVPFTENTIKQLHRDLLQYVTKDTRHRGQYKTMPNSVVAVDNKGQQIGVVFETTPPYLTPKAMQELVEWTQTALAQNRIHPLLVIGNFLVEFLNIHPFQDGNGRLSRVITNLLLLQHGYTFVPYVSHEKIVEDNKQDYYLALRRSQKTFGREEMDDIKPWLKFFLGAVKTQADKALVLLEENHIEENLSPQQSAVLKHLHRIKESSVSEIAEHAKIPRPTVSQALRRLLQLKLIKRFGQGPATRYQLVEREKQA